MLAGGQRGCGLRVVQVIRRGDVDDIDPLVVQHGLEAVVGGRQAKRASAFRGPGMAGSNDTMHLNAQATQGFHVHHADEARTHHGRADSSDRPRRDLLSHSAFIRNALTLRAFSRLVFAVFIQPTLLGSTTTARALLPFSEA